MSWLLFALLSVFFFSLSSLIQRVLMKKEQNDAYVYSVVFQLLGALIIGIFAFSKGFIMPPIASLPINFILLTVLYGFGTLCMFNAFKYLEASEVTMLGASRAVITILSAVFILSEIFTFNNGVGTILILFAVVLITYEKKSFKLNKGTLYALGMALFFGLALTNDTYLIKFVDVFSFTTFGFLLPGLFLILIKPTIIPKLKVFLNPKIFGKMFLLDFIYAAGSICFYYAIEQGAHASQAVPIMQSTVIVTVILAAIFLKERDHLLKKLIGAILITMGILLLK
ncbi:MAG: DMT family transporter [Candidatus Levyibacteriota bacterium]